MNGSIEFIFYLINNPLSPSAIGNLLLQNMKNNFDFFIWVSHKFPQCMEGLSV